MATHYHAENHHLNGRPGSHPRAWLREANSWIVALLRLYLIIWYGWFLSGRGTPDFRSMVGNLALLPMDLGTAVVTLLAARRAQYPRLKVGLALAAAGFFCYFAGDVSWFVYERILRIVPTFSPVEIAYGSGYGLLLIALVKLRSPGRSLGNAIRIWLDAGLVMAFGAIVMWQFVVGPALTNDHELLVKTLAMLGPMVSLALVHATTVLLLETRDQRVRRAFTFMGLGLLLQVWASVLFMEQGLAGTYVSGGWSDTFTLTGFFLFLLGAHLAPAELDPVTRPYGDSPVYIASALPYLAAAGAYVYLLWIAFAGPDDAFQPAASFAALTSILVLLRQIVVILENRQLLKQSVSLNNQIRASESRFRSMFQHSSDVISILDEGGIIRYQTPSGGRVFGYDPSTVLGTPFFELVHPDDQSLLTGLLADLRRLDGDIRVERWRMRSTEKELWSFTETVVTNLLADPEIQGFMLNTRDVTDRARLELEMRQRAYSDPLTGLANRSLFREQLEQAIDRGAFAVLLLDLDGFKTINDSLGHDSGDRLLVEVAARLSRCVRRDKDTVARLGGDEFAIILPGGNEGAAVRVSCEIIAALQKPVVLPGKEVSVFTSIGVTTSRRSQCSADAVFRDADVAMYAAKAQGKGRYSLFEPRMHAAAVQRMEMEADLRAAVNHGAFVVHFQPELSLPDRRVVGLEALVRWQHPVRGLLAPGEFIPLAEEVGLIAAIDMLALRRACAFAGRLRQRPGPQPPPFLAVNVSGRHSLTRDLPKVIADLLAEYGLEPRSLVLEITESTFIQQSARTAPILDAIRQLGVQIAVDDFGTGYSALSYLRDLPIDILKIDRSFIQALGDGSRQDAIVKGIIDLAHALSLSTVAEGVETAEQEQILQAMGCSFGQGFRYARPLPEADILDHFGS